MNLINNGLKKENKPNENGTAQDRNYQYCFNFEPYLKLKKTIIGGKK
jgi:hypothetical protein